MTNRKRTYTELSKLSTIEDRFNYLKLDGSVGLDTFGHDRYLNQFFYRSPEWKRVRNEVILRDNGCDLGIPDHEIYGKVLIHHMNPIDPKDIYEKDPDILNPEYLICTSFSTHNAIHYGDQSQITDNVIERSPNDTIPWRKINER